MIRRTAAGAAGRIDSFHSSFPVGSLPSLHAAVRDLHGADRIEEAPGLLARRT